MRVHALESVKAMSRRSAVGLEWYPVALVGSARASAVLVCAVFVGAMLVGGAPVRMATAETVTMRSGMQFEGVAVEISGIAENPLKPMDAAGPVAVKKIVMIDDDLRRVFVPQRQIAAVAPSETGSRERITIEQRVARDGRRVASVGVILRTTSWDEWGRRILTMSGGKQGRIDLIQGITEITPVYTKVEGLMGAGSLALDMRIRTSTLPRETLSRILLRHIDVKNPDDRLKIVRLYIQSERYKDAREELERVLKDFPELTELESQVKSLYQLNARRLIREIELRRDAGQHQLVHSMLAHFPSEGVAGETLLRVRDLLGEYEQRIKQRETVIANLAVHLEALEDAELKAEIAAVVEEIGAELNINNLERMADYLRLADDEKLAVEQRLALAISGWMLGNGAGIDNLAVASSLPEVRKLVRQYLASTGQHERDDALQQLGKLEGGTPNYLAPLLAHLTPDTGELSEPVQGIPGLYELSTPGLTGQEDFRYLIQLPPEYDPYRRYPCVMTLHASGTDPLKQIEWWAGGYSPAENLRLGQATRRGYIVIAPYWMRPHQAAYEYSAREHAAVLMTLRDACRRFSIDTDRVFLTGHSMGGDAAWDLGLAHPDLWAGVIPIVASAGKYVSRYWENASLVPWYFIFGELDGSRVMDNAMDLDRYLKRSSGGFDVTVVEYRGRGHEHFVDEIQEIFDWMGLAAHRRQFFPKQFEAVTLRPWDNFFWWIEAHEFPDRAMVLPLSWPDPKANPATISGEIVPANNRVVAKANAARTVVLLSPELVDFSRPIRVEIDGRDVREEIQPTAAVILEDVRSRGDRYHPFWARVELRTNRGR